MEKNSTILSLEKSGCIEHWLSEQLTQFVLFVGELGPVVAVFEELEHVGAVVEELEYVGAVVEELEPVVGAVVVEAVVSR